MPVPGKKPILIHIDASQEFIRYLCNMARPIRKAWRNRLEEMIIKSPEELGLKQEKTHLSLERYIDSIIRIRRYEPVSICPTEIRIAESSMQKYVTIFADENTNTYEKHGNDDCDPKPPGGGASIHAFPAGNNFLMLLALLQIKIDNRAFVRGFKEATLMQPSLSAVDARDLVAAPADLCRDGVANWFRGMKPLVASASDAARRIDASARAAPTGWSEDFLRSRQIVASAADARDLVAAPADFCRAAPADWFKWVKRFVTSAGAATRRVDLSPTGWRGDFLRSRQIVATAVDATRQAPCRVAIALGAAVHYWTAGSMALGLRTGLRYC